MAAEVRPVEADEFPAFLRAMAVGFGFHFADDEVERRQVLFEEGRALAGLDDGRVVGTARSFRTDLTVPGGATVPAGAVTNVTVHPGHRRRGLLRAMMTRQLDDVAAAGEPVAILIASEHPIYGRFGYGPATVSSSLEVEARAARFRPDAPPVEGVRWVTAKEARDHAAGVYERFRVAQPGAIGRRERTWDALFGQISDITPDPGSHWYLVHDDGYARYRLEDRWVDRQPAITLHVDELVATTPAAYAALWRTVVEMDLVATVKAADRPEREPLPWLLHDARVVRRPSTADFLWVRLLDVPAALAARRYPVAGRLVLDVADPVRPASGGRFVLEAGPDGAACRPAASGEAPDLALGTAALAACYLGDARPSVLAAAGLVEERTTGAAATADALFASTPAPWCHTWF
jgi:predicted acetyltransferase